MRNLILIHLESLDYVKYVTRKKAWNYLAGIEDLSVSFSNFYVSATSTIMTLGDIAYGDLMCNEHLKTLCENKAVVSERESLPDKMIKLGYKFFMPFLSPVIDEDVKIRSENGLVGQLAHLSQYTDVTIERNDIEAFISGNTPFFLWDVNGINHITQNVIIKESDGIKRWERSRYELQDHIKFILNLIEKKGYMDNTTIILYGDHGDDICIHGTHQGYTHATEPYASLTHTPLMILDNRIGRSIMIDRLIGVERLNWIIERLMCSERVYEKGWIEHITGDDYVFSRNQFAAQRLQPGRFNKGYSLTDGKWYLLATNYGLSLYNLEMDPLCFHNYLDYYNFDGKVISLDYRSIHSLAHHFRELVGLDATKHITEVFQTMYPKLKKRIIDIHVVAGCMDGINTVEMDGINYSEEELRRRRYFDSIKDDELTELKNHFYNYTESEEVFWERNDRNGDIFFKGSVFDKVNLNENGSVIEVKRIFDEKFEVPEGWKLLRKDGERWYSPFVEDSLVEIIRYIESMGYDAIEANILNTLNDGRVCYNHFYGKSHEVRLFRTSVDGRRKFFPIRFCVVSAEEPEDDMSQIGTSLEKALSDGKKAFMGIGIEIFDMVDYGIDVKPMIGKNIIIYGAGQYGQYCYEKLEKCANIIAWIDKDFSMMPWQKGREIEPIDVLLRYDFDYVFVAITSGATRTQVMNSLVCMGIDEKNIL